MTRPLTSAELQLLASLSSGRLLTFDIDPKHIRPLANEGLVKNSLGHGVLSVKGALAAMGSSRD